MFGAAGGTGGRFGAMQQQQPSSAAAGNGDSAAGSEAGSSTTAAVSEATAEAAASKSYTQSLWNMASSNPYFHAGAGLYSLTVMSMFARSAMRGLTVALRRRFVVSLETTNNDPAFNWLMQWMSRHPSFHFQQMSVISTKVMIHANDEHSSDSTFAPCPDIPHYMLHEGWPIMITRKRQLERAMGNEVLETIQMTTLGRSGETLKRIMHSAKKDAILKDSDRTIIYHNVGSRWCRHQEGRSRRPLESVILEGSMRGELLADVTQFLDSKEYYLHLGVPYRRGYLLHGPPGCGKSSLVMALAGELRLAICVLSLSNRALDDDSLNTLLNEAPQRSVVLLEDIDRAFTADSRVTMSGLLNALDGVAAQEGRIVFMTTNHVERLDPALVRPGRADCKLEIGLMTTQQIEYLFAKFFPESTGEQRRQFSLKLPDRGISPAQLQSHLFAHRNSPEDAIKSVPKFLSGVHHFEEQVRKKLEMESKIRDVRSPPML